MKSKTKFSIDNSTVITLFKKAGFNEVCEIAPLTAGEFNSAYTAVADGKPCVLKLSPQSGAKVLTYEKNLMEQEVKFYKLIAQQTDVKTPKIYFYDNSRTLVPADFFVMEKLSSKPLSELKLAEEERKAVNIKIGEMIAKLHKIKGESYGYCQNLLKDNWYEALKQMTNNLISDCVSVKKPFDMGSELLEYAEKHKELLLKVPCIYTHFDIWEGNIFYEKIRGKISLTLIDTERSFFGDGLGDFCSIDAMHDLTDKKEILQGYNFLADNPVTGTEEEQIRFAFTQAYLAFIMHTERFVRYSHLQPKYLMNKLFSKLLFKKAASVLKK